MRKLTKQIALALAWILVFSLLAACSKSKDKSEQKSTNAPAVTGTEQASPAPMKGETMEHSGYTVLIPEGFSLQEPGEISYYDFAVQKSSFSYFKFVTSDPDEEIMSKYEYNKNTYTNEQTDVEAVYGENTWTGFQYSDGWGGFGIEAYANVGGKLIRVSSAGFRFDSEEVKAILGSVKAG